jgi:HEAT repeat protein
VVFTALALSLLLLAGPFVRPAAGAQAAVATGSVKQNIANLAASDFPVRMQAARLIRRTPATDAVPALVEAARRDPNEYVRYKALVVLTAFNEPGTRDLMRDLMRDRNDRVREVVYKWFEEHPDPRIASVLIELLQTEQAEFVRPALVGALAALGAETAVQRPLIVETARGFDVFRSAVIDALGRHRAVYALDAIIGVSRIEGPLQDDAVLALGRIGGLRATAALKDLREMTPEAAVMVRGARCLAGESCAEHLAALISIAESTDARVSEVRAAVDALSAVAQGANESATAAVAALMRFAVRDGSVRERVAVAFAGVALRQPDPTVAWINAAEEAPREAAIALLKDGFDRLDEDFAEEQFFAAVRAGYWRAEEGSARRALAATLIQRLEF